MKMKARILVIAGVALTIIAVLLARSCSTPANKGKLVYQDHCANCHGDNGEGFAMYPPLANADYLIEHRNSFACVVQYGLKDTILVNGKEYNLAMPANLELSETDITNLANYIYGKYTPVKYTFTQREIQEQLENCTPK